MLEKLLINNQKGSAGIGIVLTVFFLLLFILIPLNQIVMEVNFLNLTKSQSAIATEIAGIDCLLNLKPEELSEGDMEVKLNINAYFCQVLQDNLELKNCDIAPFDVQVNVIKDLGHRKIVIFYKYFYKTHYISPGKFEKQIIVNLEYEVPINN